MPDCLRLLVVDAEPAICEACRRALVGQGFEVERLLDGRDGLHRAREGDFAGILLDTKMHGIDGIAFLEELRKVKPHVPVMILTGEPNVPNASAAVRLGALDYMIKPCPPEELGRAVRRMIAHRSSSGNGHAIAFEPPATLSAEAENGFLFYDEAWLRSEVDGSACVGVVLAASGAGCAGAGLPEVGEVVYQGLPLAAVKLADGCSVVVPSPVSGVVVGVNERLAADPSLVVRDPCGEGWLACICTTRLEEESRQCQPRRVVLVNRDARRQREQRQRLESLGCRVELAPTLEAVEPLLARPGRALVVVDEASLGPEGPELVARVNDALPEARVLVIAPPKPAREAAYRAMRILYYAVEPLSEAEVVGVLDSVFRVAPPAEPAGPAEPEAEEPMAVLEASHPGGRKVQLLAGPGLLRRGRGLGGWIRRRLACRGFSAVARDARIELTPRNVRRLAEGCDRLVVLVAIDRGRLPGSLARDARTELVAAMPDGASRATVLVVQPDARSAGLSGLDARTTAALAEHIAREMTWH